MATLPRLAKLKLNLQCDFEDLATSETSHRARWQPLASVTKLQLNLLHSQLQVCHFAATFAKLFPGLQKIEIRSEQCDFLSQIDQCIFGLFAQLQSCRLLSTTAVKHSVWPVCLACRHGAIANKPVTKCFLGLQTFTINYLLINDSLA